MFSSAASNLLLIPFSKIFISDNWFFFVCFYWFFLGYSLFSLLLFLSSNTFGSGWGPSFSVWVFSFNNYFKKFVFWPCCVACGIWVSPPGIEPASPAGQVWSLNHRTARKVPASVFIGKGQIEDYYGLNFDQNLYTGVLSPRTSTCVFIWR